MRLLSWPVVCAVAALGCGDGGGGGDRAPSPTPPAAAGAVFYVSVDGSDSNPGSRAQPWRTIQKAADTLSAGETVYIRAGTYAERVVPRASGAPGADITYSAYPGEAVILDGSGVALPDDVAGLFDISGRSHLRVVGLRVVHVTGHRDNVGILVSGSSDIALVSDSTDDTISSGVASWDSRNLTISGSTVERAGSGGMQECLTVAGTDGFEVSGSMVRACDKEGICIKDGAANGRVFGNQVADVHSVGIYVDAWDKHTHGIEISRNLVHDVRGSGLSLASERGGLLEAVRIFDNVAYHNQWLGVQVSTNGDSATHPMREVRIVNNTFHGNGWSWGGGIAVDNPDARDLVVRNNLCSDDRDFEMVRASAVPEAQVTIDHNLIGVFREYPEEVTGRDAVVGDPLLRDPAAADFHLRAGSPAIDAGSASDAPVLDFDGVSRPQGGGHDIGAYEYVP